MNIKAVHTSSVIFTVEEEVDLPSDKVYVKGCTINQTNYGSVTIEREDRNKIELYPSAIYSIIYQN